MRRTSKKALKLARARFQPEIIDFRSIAPAVLGARIVQRRKYLNLNQKELAKLVDLTPAAMCRIEKGQATPMVATVSRICAQMQCSLSQLIYPVEPELRDDRLSALASSASKGGPADA